MSLEEIPSLQAEVDALDARLVELLRQRLSLSRRIGTIKRDAAQRSFDPNRIQTRRVKFLRLCEQAGFPSAMAEGLFALIADQVAVERKVIFEAPATRSAP